MGRKPDGDFGIKFQIRALLAGSGISYNDLEPKYAGNDSLKSMVETLMYKHKVSVKDLKQGTFYINLENGKNTGDDHHIINDNNNKDIEVDDDIINNDKMMMEKMKMMKMKMKMKMLKMKRKMLKMKMKMMMKKKDTYDYNIDESEVKDMDGFLDVDRLLAPPQISMLLKSPNRIEKNKKNNEQLSNAWR